MPNRLSLLREYVSGGGGLVMIGGYFTFQGFDAKARYAGTPVEDALPVTMLPYDDRVEAPEGIVPVITGSGDHPVVSGLPREWPAVLGYNRLTAKEGASVLAQVGGDPLLAAWTFGAGRAVAFASDCGPHWLPPAFLAWDGYDRLWSQLVGWVAGASA